MPAPRFDFDVTSEPAMPPPPPDDARAEPPAMAKTAEPGHKPVRGEPR